MSHNKLESARFAQVSDQAAGKMLDGVEKILSESAARGFAIPGGDTLFKILDVVDEARATVVEGNGKIYEERSGQIFEVEKFALDYLVKMAKLAMDLYREQLFNEIALEQAQQSADTERSRAEIARMNTRTEARMVAIIRDKAEMERRILAYKQQLVEAEGLTVAAESVLEDAKITTAEKKLEIIDSIYQVIAAEQLVIAAERRRAASMEQVLEAKQVVAAIKREMVPFYIQKAQARQALALATEQEIPVLRALEELGYDRIALRDAEEDEKHRERQLDLEYEMAQEEYVRAHNAQELAKKQLSRLLLEYSNDLKAMIIDQKANLLKDEVAFRLATGLSREAIDINNRIDLHTHDRINLITELSSVLRNMELRALDETGRVKASAVTQDKRTTTHLYSRRIREGFIVG
jgi:hypothetical protein